jgi:hypothetical protein
MFESGRYQDSFYPQYYHVNYKEYPHPFGL